MKIDQLDNLNVVFTDSSGVIISVFSRMFLSVPLALDNSVLISSGFTPDEVRNGIVLKPSEVTEINGVAFDGDLDSLKTELSSKINF